ncbi:MAG TPA: UvrD-helicase domain-containing protein [Dehalococcoidia bacterium]|nr:UvrD-helicase domain-containing protein [Dehalococcoidia bacterium]
MSGDRDFHLRQDEETRQRIVQQLDETLFVEAGAGTGKTRVLVERYVALVLAGRRVEELVAITFTEKAAAEMRDRVRAELERRLRAGEGNAELLVAALEGLDRAQISTIHAFALQVLRTFAAEQGIDPSFGVQDELAAERRFQERWRSFLEEAGSEPDCRAAFGRALALGLTTRDIERLATELWRQGAIAEMLEVSPPAAPPDPGIDLRAMRERLAGLGFERVPAEDRLRSAIERALAALDDLIGAPAEEFDALLADVAPMLRGNGSAGTSRNWAAAVPVELARQALRSVSEELDAALAARRGEALARLLPVLLRFVAGESRARLQDGQLMFDDLILRLRDVLRDNEDARLRLRRRYRALLIDEFQDTDPLQVEIALLFARDPVSGRVEPGRLFLVGDPKQSIYRFRRADMAVYAATRREVEEGGGGLPQLALNRRSRKAVLGFVNQVFERLIGSGDSPGVQPPYRGVEWLREDDLAGPGVGWSGGPVEMNARDARRHEAGQVAAWCRAALEQGWQVWDRVDGRARPAAYRDIAILIPSRAILQPLERALSSAGIPYRVEGGSLVYATQEVRDLINCLTAIDDPTDEVAVVAALRSPAYACSDVELARHRLGGGSFNYLSPALEASQGRVVEALLDLRQFHQSRAAGRLAAMVERFVASRRLVEAGMFDAGNRDAYRRARFVIEQARAFEADGPQTLGALVDWLERRAGRAILDHEGAGLDDDEDAVRVLTIHAAKGLEFPIVFIAGLGVGPGYRYEALGLDRSTGQVSVTIGSRTRGARFDLGPVEAIEAQEKAHEEAERARLLYVAATRARDHLVLFLYHPQRATAPLAQRLIEAGAREAAGEMPALQEVADAGAEPFGGLVVDEPPVADVQFETVRAAFVASVQEKTAAVTSATALGRMEAMAGEEGAEGEREDEGEPWARGRAGTRLGRAVHAALQVIPWDADGETIRALARAQAVAEAVPEESGRIESLLRAALATHAAARARAARRASREVPFALLRDGVTIEGFVDLVLETDEGLELIDWKTDDVPEAAVPARLKEYQLQAGLYVLGLEAATGRPVRRVTYAFVAPGVEASPGEPGELARMARERLSPRVRAASAEGQPAAAGQQLRLEI